MARRHIDPRITNNFVDSCAFDPKYSPEDAAALHLFELYKNGVLLLQIAHSTQKELEHPNTPPWVKKESASLVYTIETSLTPGQRKVRDEALRILAGNGKPENVFQDAQHVFEAGNYGSYFVTTDERILKKRTELCGLCDIDIVKPSELVAIYRTYENTQLQFERDGPSASRQYDRSSCLAPQLERPGVELTQADRGRRNGRYPIQRVRDPCGPVQTRGHGAMAD